MSAAETVDGEREWKLRRRARDSFEYFAPAALKIAVKEADDTDRGAVRPFELNGVQTFVHGKIEAQKQLLGKVRAIILKGRQQGVSTYTEGRFYWRVIHTRGVKAYILTHKAEATDNLFAMVDRFHAHCPPMFRPHVGKSNAKELEFDKLDSRYTVATAGAKGAGRSGTVHFFHGSEVALWQDADEHMKGALQAVPDLPGTEIILESTAQGVGNEFHRLWTAAESGGSDFIPIFVPWFWQTEYRQKIASGFELSDAAGDVPEGELTEADYARAYKCQLEQMAWRRKKIVELGYWGFKQEYPATAAEAFQTSGERSLVPVSLIVKARRFEKAAAFGELVIGIDPAGPGKDAMAIIRRKARVAFSPQLFHKLSMPQQAGLVIRIIKGERPKHVFIDVGGVGWGLTSTLLESSAIQPGIVVPVNFGAEPLDRDRFTNKKAEMYWGIREWFDDQAGVSIPDVAPWGDMLQSQLLTTLFSYDGAQRLKIRSKEELRSKGIPSPDLLDALACTFAFPVASSAKMPGVEVDMLAGWEDSGWGDTAGSGSGWSVFDD